jgi:hypothetical protein
MQKAKHQVGRRKKSPRPNYEFRKVSKTQDHHEACCSN